MEFNKVLVPVSGTKADKTAIELACQMTNRMEGKIYAIYVIQVKRTLPLDAEITSETEKGKAVLEQAERIAKAEYRQVETELLQARQLGSTIVDEAVERGVDVIMMGVRYETQFGQFSLGDTMPYVLKNAPCRVLVCREPITEE